MEKTQNYYSLSDLLIGNKMVEAIVLYFSGTLGLIELGGTIASLICVWLAIKQNIWTWFWGIIGVLLFGYLFFQFGLYSDAGLQILFFLPCQIWGWLTWKNIEKNNKQQVTILSNKDRLMLVAGILICSVINGYFMFTFTNASFPFLDALTTWMSVFAQILMIKKILESWVLWVSMDMLAIYIYFAKGLFITSGLYAIFLVLATAGLITWYLDRKKYV